eukprot:1279633-Pleurochrysis_carterae.AAC.1
MRQTVELLCMHSLLQVRERIHRLIQQQCGGDAVEQLSSHRVSVVVRTTLSGFVHQEEQLAARVTFAPTKRQSQYVDRGCRHVTPDQPGVHGGDLGVSSVEVS